MRVAKEPWLLPRRALTEPFGPDWPAWTAHLAALSQPFALSPQELPSALRFGTALGWLDPGSLPRSLRREVAGAMAGAAALAARVRLHGTLAWLLDRRAQFAPWPEAATQRALLQAVARLDPELLPRAADETPAARHALRPLARLRRYGPDEEYIAAELGQAIADYPEVPEASAAGWLLGHLNLAAAWVGLTRGRGESFRKLVQRSAVVEDSWPGWLILGRQEPATARYRAHLAGEAAWRAAQPLAGAEPEAVAWQRAEAVGWMLAAAGESRPDRVRAGEPGILTGG